MSRYEWLSRSGPVILMALLAAPASAQSFRVQCPTSTITHPTPANNSAEPIYDPTTNAVDGAIKCQQLSGGDGFATMADGTQTYLFAFGPLSGLTDIASGQPGTQFPNVFNVPYAGATPLAPGDPLTNNLAGYNGAVGLAPDQAASKRDALGNVTLNCSDPANAANPACITGHVDPRQIMDVGVMNGNMPAPLMAIDEDDEFFLTLTNVGMVMRPDLFEQHTVHFHGYPNASAFYDGVPDASVAINIGASFTYYYLAPDAGTYFWHCHITPPEHLQMGMVGQLYVRPRQNRVADGTNLYKALGWQQASLRTKCDPTQDILCSNPLPPKDTNATHVAGTMYAYNDGDGSTAYDVEYPLQIHGFDPNFHFVGMTFNPEGFADMKDKYFLLNGRSYPDTVGGTTDGTGAVVKGPMTTQASDGTSHVSQPMHAVITIPAGKKALLRISSLDVSEYQTLASLGIPMKVVGYNAKLLRDQSGNNLYYTTNSITLGGGESLDVILDTTGIPAGTYYLYTPNLDHLSNDAENFGGLMTEVRIN